MLSLGRLLLPVGWVLAAVGYYGPWIAHETAALTLTGSDMAEFVKFLPGTLDGSLRVVRQLFYLPLVAVAFGVALLVGSKPLRYSPALRFIVLALSLATSIQLLPPAWSLGSLMSPEFRLQPIALGICWLALAGFRLLGRLPIRLTGLLSFTLAILAGILPVWQMTEIGSAIGAVYGMPVRVGWGCVTCFAGLAVLACAGAALALCWDSVTPK